MYVKFKVLDAKTNNVVRNFDFYHESYMCFAPVRSLPVNSDGYIIKYKLTNINFTAEQTKQYNDFWNENGLVAEVTIDEKGIEFTVNYNKTTDNYFHILSTLCARRYMEEEPLDIIIKDWFMLINKFPSIDKFYLFQLAHYYRDNYTGYNSNHAFIGVRSDFYTGPYIRFLCNKEQFKDRLKSHATLNGMFGEFKSPITKKDFVTATHFANEESVNNLIKSLSK